MLFPRNFKIHINYILNLLRVRMFLRTGSLQTKLNGGLSEQQQQDLFQTERSFHEVNSKQHVLDKLTRPPPN